MNIGVDNWLDPLFTLGNNGLFIGVFIWFVFIPVLMPVLIPVLIPAFIPKLLFKLLKLGNWLLNWLVKIFDPVNGNEFICWWLLVCWIILQRLLIHLQPVEQSTSVEQIYRIHLLFWQIKPCEQWELLEHYLQIPN